MTNQQMADLLQEIIKRIERLEATSKRKLGLDPAKAGDGKIGDTRAARDAQASDARAIAHIARKFGGTVDTPAHVREAARQKQQEDVARIEAINAANREGWGLGPQGARVKR